MPTHHNRRLLGASLATAAAVLLSACASTPPPTAELAVSNAAVANATSAGAGDMAPVELKSARDKLEGAKAAMTAKDYAQARTLADEALADAQLAEAKTRAGKARQAEDALREGRRVLKEELDRKPQ